MRAETPRIAWLLSLTACLRWVFLAPLVSVLFAPPAAYANGGTLRMNRQPAGPYAVTIFTSPTPLTPGIADVSASLEFADTGDIEPDARIVIAAQPVGHAGQAGVFEATHDRASDPNFYAANVRLDSAGAWRMDVQIIGLRGEGTVAFDVDIAENVSGERILRGAAVVVAIWLGVGAWVYWRRRRRLSRRSLP